MIFVIALLGSGCGSGTPKGDVSGTVTYKGKPVPRSTLTFLDAKNEALGSSSITDGKYLIGRVRPGLVRIVVSAPPVPPPGGPKLPRGFKKFFPVDRKIPEGAKVTKNEKGQMFAEPELPADAPTRLSTPGRYAQPDSSGLSYTVQSGSQKHDINLEE
jgi:hypothetical protein